MLSNSSCSSCPNSERLALPLQPHRLLYLIASGGENKSLAVRTGRRACGLQRRGGSLEFYLILIVCYIRKDSYGCQR